MDAGTDGGTGGGMHHDRPAGGFSGVVLAGGTGARMGGIDKAAVELGGRTLLEHAVEAFLDADEVVVVAPASVPTTRRVTFVCEDPPRGGPVAGLLTGLDAMLRRPGLVGVLAVDMPRATATTFRRLRQAAAGHDGAFLHDPGGRRQLAGVLDVARLSQVRPDLEGQHSMALHRLLSPLHLAAVAAHDDEAVDIDSWADLRDLAE